MKICYLADAAEALLANESRTVLPAERVGLEGSWPDDADGCAGQQEMEEIARQVFQE